jgi:glycosyltransferase involved in cell wall biosynthesis
MVEAQAAGCPVISYQKGGALETVIDGKTGIFFQEQTRDSLRDAIERFTQTQDPFLEDDLVANAQQFSAERFKQEFAKFAGMASTGNPI